MYSLGMTGAEYNPNDTQPNNPNFSDWYAKLMCPWNVDECGADDGLLNDNEHNGVPVCPWGDIGNPWKCAPNQHPQYPIFPADVYVKDEPDRRTMSCALCGRLKRTFKGLVPVGAPTKIKKAIGVEYSLAGVPKGGPPTSLRCAFPPMHVCGSVRGIAGVCVCVCMPPCVLCMWRTALIT
jgi:hypothetical protein